MGNSNTEAVKKSFQKYARPTITIPKEKNQVYKNFVAGKGYNSLNDYFNHVLEYDMKYSIFPDKGDCK